MPRPGIEPGLLDGDPAVLTTRLRSRWVHASYQTLKYPNCTILVVALTLYLHAGTFAWLSPYSEPLTTKKNFCVSFCHYQRARPLAFNLSRFLSWSADLRFNHLFHWINDIPASLDPPISAFYSLRLMTYLRSLTCIFLNVKVFVNEFTTCERPGALLDVLHRDLCHPWKSEQASLGLHSAFHRA